MKISVLWGILIILFLNPVRAQETSNDSVVVTFEVVVPESTPEDDTIFWAGSLNRWDPGDKGTGFSAKDFSIPAEKSGGRWAVELKAPSGSEETYKYTRGSIFSVEENADYTYRPVRKIVFDRTKVVTDTVKAWHDIPPEALAGNWPLVSLSKAEINFAMNGRVMDGLDTILYDLETGSQFFDASKTAVDLTAIPDHLMEPVFYLLRVSEADNRYLTLVAGRSEPEGPWEIYADRNSDRNIEPPERLFTVGPGSEGNRWQGIISFTVERNGETRTDSTTASIRHAPDLPGGYTSSMIPGAPDLTYELPFKHRRGTIANNTFYLTSGFASQFSSSFWLLVDRDRNDTLEVGSGSNEVTTIDSREMHIQQRFYLHPVFRLGDDHWEVAGIDPQGTWIRFRPAKEAVTQSEIAVGKPAPQWEAVTVRGDTLSLNTLRGTYVLLDFWGSWCGPCIEELPLLREVYHRFASDTFEMVGFAYESAASLQKALDTYRLPWPQVLDEGGDYSKIFVVRSYPTHYLVGPDGTILEMGNSLRGKRLIPTLEKYID